jgi:hypothetical protein
MFFKRKSTAPDSSDKAARKEALALPRRKTVQFEPEKMNISELDEMMKSDLHSTLLKAFPPANYYKNKRSWLECELYFNDDYTVIYTRLVTHVNERTTGSTDFYRLDYELLRSLLRRFGQNISIDNDKKERGFALSICSREQNT